MAYTQRTFKGGPIAVIGSGLAGIVATLYLADAGLPVVMFERNATLFSGASAVCEGKIHLGYTYALDHSQATTQRLLSGASSFRRILCRWVPEFGLGLSERSFIYACPRDSMIPEEGVAAHLARVEEQVDAWDGELLRQPQTPLRRLSVAETDNLFDQRNISAAWETGEIASHPAATRPFILAALSAHPLVETRTDAEVTNVTRSDNGFVLTWGAENLRETFNAVINASWEQRLRLDAKIGLLPPRSVVHRFKCGLHLQNRGLADQTPSVTFVIGEYGDTVACGDRIYVSWYRAGLLKSEVAIAPDPTPLLIPPSVEEKITHESISAVARYMPKYGAVLAKHVNAFRVRGGYISAWGNSGIADPKSGLHSRAEIGVSSLPRFHSINTGKYTTAPKYGEVAAQRVLSEMGFS